MDVFVLAGQSNMAGRGKIEDHQEVNEHVLVWDSRKRKWQEARDPIHSDKPSRCGVGPGLAFALTLLKKKDYSKRKIGLVPCAVGGTDIETWLSERKDEITGLNPWKECVLKTKNALSSSSSSNVLCAILWHQGESDCTDTKSKTYGKRLVDVVKKFRTEFESSSLPFLCGQLGCFEKKPWNEHYKLVDKSHRMLSTLLPNCAFVSSKGLTSFDGLHFDTRSAKLLGVRYANEYHKMKLI